MQEVAKYARTSSIVGHVTLPPLLLPPTRRLVQRSRFDLPWSACHRGSGYIVWALLAARQSIDSGVSLPPAEDVDECARFLADAIRQYLDQEWIPQECHEEIGEEVARLYRATVDRGETDMTTLVMETGSAMEKFDMGDAFVGPWDIANLVSDFLMQRMGAEVSGCSSKIPASIPPSTAFRLKTDAVRRVKSDLTSDFSRYRFLVDFMADDSKWEEANTIVALYQGYTPDDADGEGAPGVRVRRGWARVFEGPFPPDLSTAEGVVEALEADFPDDPDMLEGLEVIVETVYGGEANRMDAGNPEGGIPPNPFYLRRATVCKWLYLMGFLQDDIKRAPDDPEELAELIAGRARLKDEARSP